MAGARAAREMLGPPARALRRGGGAARRHLTVAVGGPARTRVVVLLACILALASADTATVGASAVELRRALGISNTDVGLLVTVTSVVAAVFSVPFGVMADRGRRTWILGAALLTWGAAMLWSASAGSFGELLLARLCLGAVTAAAGPVVASLVGDWFPANERGRIYGFILTGELLGAGAGFAVTGDIAALSWRAAFVILALPAFVLAWLFARLPEPARGGADVLVAEPAARPGAGAQRPAGPGPHAADGPHPGQWPPGQGPHTPGGPHPGQWPPGQGPHAAGGPHPRQWPPGQGPHTPGGPHRGQWPPGQGPHAGQGAHAGAEPSAGAPGGDQRAAGDAGPGPADVHRLARDKGIQPDRVLLRRARPRMGFAEAVRYVLAVRTNVALIISSACGYYFLAGVQTFGTEFVGGQYHIGQVVANLLLVLVGAGSVVGVLASGPLGDSLLRRGHLNARIATAAVAGTAAVILFIPALITHSAITALPYVVGAAAALSAQNPPIDAARLDIMPPWLWGRAEGIRTFLRTAAQALAPVLFGVVSDEIFGGGTSGLRWTFVVMLLPLAASAFFLYRAMRDYPRDVATAGVLTSRAAH